MDKFSATKVKECTLTCSVNRDLSRRIKQTSHVAWARKCMQADIGHALNLIEWVSWIFPNCFYLLLLLFSYFDKKSLLWDYSEDSNKKVCRADLSVCMCLDMQCTWLISRSLSGQCFVSRWIRFWLETCPCFWKRRSLPWRRVKMRKEPSVTTAWTQCKKPVRKWRSVTVPWV